MPGMGEVQVLPRATLGVVPVSEDSKNNHVPIGAELCAWFLGFTSLLMHSSTEYSPPSGASGQGHLGILEIHKQCQEAERHSFRQFHAQLSPSTIMLFK